MNLLASVFRFFGNVDKPTRFAVAGIWLGAFFLLWMFSPIKALPYPKEVVTALGEMWRKDLAYNTFVTLKLNIVGLLYASVLSLIFTYISVIPALQPLNRTVQWLRYIPIIGFNLVFLTLFTLGWPMKVAMMTTGMTFFLTTGMTSVVTAIPRMKFELARVLGYGDFQVFYTVVVRPTLPKMVEQVAQNAAIGWVMVTSIETYNRTEGGIGAQIYAYSSTNQLAHVYGLLLVIGVIAILEDVTFTVLNRMLFPYSTIAERG